MGTDVEIFLEKKDEYDNWDGVDITPELQEAIDCLESRNYFVYAFLAGVRNYYLLKNDIGYYDLRRTDEEANKIIRQWEINNAPDDRCGYGYGYGHPDYYDVYSRFDVSLSTARECWDAPTHAVDVKNLVEFNYDQVIVLKDDPDPFYESCQRTLTENTTYRDEFSEHFFNAIKTLEKNGVDRIVMSFD